MKIDKMDALKDRIEIIEGRLDDHIELIRKALKSTAPKGHSEAIGASSREVVDELRAELLEVRTKLSASEMERVTWRSIVEKPEANRRVALLTKTGIHHFAKREADGRWMIETPFGEWKPSGIDENDPTHKWCPMPKED